DVTMDGAQPRAPAKAPAVTLLLTRLRWVRATAFGFGLRRVTRVSVRNGWVVLDWLFCALLRLGGSFHPSSGRFAGRRLWRFAGLTLSRPWLTDLELTDVATASPTTDRQRRSSAVALLEPRIGVIV